MTERLACSIARVSRRALLSVTKLGCHVRLRLLGSILISCSILFAAPASAAAVTNSDVITLVRSGLSEETIRLTVDSTAEANFDTSADALVALSEARVPESVIQAMIKRAAGAGPQAAAAPAARAAVAPTLETKRVAVLPPAITPVVGESYFTRYNFWHERNAHVTTNYSRGFFVQINTRVKLTYLAQGTMRLELPSGESVDIKLIPEFTQRPLADIASELLGTDPVPIEKLGDELAGSIGSGEIRLGMTKEQVLMTRGYPPRHRTPRLEADNWVYWSSRFVTLTLVFQNDVLILGRGIR